RMAWRKWFVRGLVYCSLGCLVLGFVLYQLWTNPSAMREQVLAKLAKIFPGGTSTLESARLRIFGGIAVAEMRMARRDDPEKTDFLYVATATVFHDKERLLDGTIAVRKVELHRPRLRVVRLRDGTLNLSGIIAPPNLKERVPTIVFQQGQVFLEDQRTTVA